MNAKPFHDFVKVGILFTGSFPPTIRIWYAMSWARKHGSSSSSCLKHAGNLVSGQSVERNVARAALLELPAA